MTDRAAAAPWRPLHTQFFAQAAATPGAVALQDGPRRWTYAALAASVRERGASLTAAGLERGARVVLALERSAELVIAALAVLACGAVCVPIDPAYPRERVEAMLAVLARAGPAWLVGELAAPGELRRLASDPTAGPWAPVEVAGDDAAFVLFTSGSTAAPRAVVTTHRGRGGRQDWTQTALPADTGDRHLLKSPVGFNTLVRELFWPLTTGGRLVVARGEAHRDPAVLARALLEHAITIVSVVPSLLRALIERDELPCCSLRRVVCSGEALAPALVAAFFARSRAELHTFYGATEAPTATAWTFDRRRPPEAVVIGRATDQDVFLVDADGRELAPAVGEVGEIWIAGDGLARGYLGDPDATAACFVDRPGRPGVRAYRTGDLGRWLADGTLEFLGRCSEQLSVGGVRVDLAAVRGHLVAHPAVREAVVSPRRDPEGRTIDLVAHVVCAPGPAPSSPRLRAFLGRRLPAAVVPTAYVPIAALPLGPHGKLDRAALPAPGPEHFLAAGPREPPRGPVEAALARIWREVVAGCEPGRRDTFVGLGGHSLAALRAIVRVREALGVELPLAALLGDDDLATTAAAIARTTRAPLARPAVAPPVAVEPAVRRAVEAALPGLAVAAVVAAPPPLVHVWFSARMAPTSTAWCQSAIYELPASVCAGALARAWTRLCVRHPALRSLFVEHDGRLLQVVLEGAAFVIEDVGDDAGLAERLAARLRRPLAAAALAPACLRLVRAGSRGARLVLATHQLACDGWSRQLVQRELSQLYAEERAQAGAAAVVDLPFADAPAAASDPAAAAWWTAALAGSGPPARPPPDVQSTAAAAGELDARWPAGDDVRALAVACGVGVSTIVLAGLAIVLARWTGRADLVVGVTLSGRDSAASEGRVGGLARALPLRVAHDEACTGRTYVQRLGAALAGVLAHRRISAEALRACVPGQEPGQPGFAAVLNMLAVPRHPLVLDGRACPRAPSPPRTAAHALELYAWDDGDALALRLAYDRGRYSDALMRACLAQIVGWCGALVRAPERRLDAPARPRPPPPELAPLAPGPTVVASVRARALAQPEAPALVAAEGRLDYAALVRTVEALAERLAGDGAAGSTVLVLGRPSLGLACAQLAVLFAGRTLLSLDADLPPLRLRALSEGAATRLLVTVGVAAPPELGALAIVAVDLAGRPLAGPSRPLVRVDPPRPGDPAYVAFTSGSDGRPRPVRVTHAALADFLGWQQRTYAVGPDDRIALTNAMGFDPAIRDLLLPVTAGGCLLVPPAEARTDAARMVAWLAGAGVSLVHLTPTLGALWLPHAPPLPRLRCLFFAGEPLPRALARAWRARAGEGARVVNLYGATEAMMVQLHHEVDDFETDRLVPAGRAIAGVAVEVVRGEAPARIGELGEIELRSPRVADGYLDGGEQRGFVGGSRYRTGDLGRLLPDGEVQVIGRLDAQLKIGGARVEPGEVEHHLTQHPAVAAAVVTAWGEGTPRLGACWVAVPGAEVTARALRAFLAERLPGALVPTRLVRVDELPRLSGGKLDRPRARAQLERPDAGEADGEDPPTAEALRVRALFEALLGRAVGLDDGFFAAGGTSLLALELVAGLARTFGCAVALGAVFPDASPRELARALGRGAPETGAQLDVLQPAGTAPALVCVPPVGGSSLCYREFAAAFAGERPVLALRERLLAEETIAERGVPERARAFAEVLVRRLGPCEVHLVGYSFGGLLAAELARILPGLGVAVGAVVLLDASLTASPHTADPDDLVASFAALLERHDLRDEAPPAAQRALWRDAMALAARHAPPWPTASDEPRPGRGGRVQRLFVAHGLLPADGTLAHRELWPYLRRLRASFRAARAHRPAPLSRPALFVAAARTTTGRDRVAPWRACCPGGLQELEVDATHLELLRPPAVAGWTDRLRRALRLLEQR